MRHQLLLNYLSMFGAGYSVGYTQSYSRTLRQSALEKRGEGQIPIKSRLNRLEAGGVEWTPAILAGLFASGCLIDFF